MNPQAEARKSLPDQASSAEASFPATQQSRRDSVKLVGVVGLGRMGQAFAANLHSGGFQVIGYDRHAERARPLQLAGAQSARGLADLADCDVVLTSLPDDEALASVALGPDGLVGVLAPGAVHISMSTVSADLSRRLAAAHAAKAQAFVAAPVFGNPDLAQAQRLFVLASGEPSAVERVQPVLEQLGQRVFVIGNDAGAANVMKLAGNTLTASTLQAMGEVLALLRKSGIDERLAFDVLTNSLFDGRVHKTYGGKIVEKRYSPAGMTAPLAVKDLRLALAEAEARAVPMPVAGLVHDRLVAVVARGWAELDWSALGLLAANDAGLGDARAPTP